MLTVPAYCRVRGPHDNILDYAGRRKTVSAHSYQGNIKSTASVASNSSSNAYCCMQPAGALSFCSVHATVPMPCTHSRHTRQARISVLLGTCCTSVYTIHHYTLPQSTAASSTQLYTTQTVQPFLNLCHSSGKITRVAAAVQERDMIKKLLASCMLPAGPLSPAAALTPDSHSKAASNLLLQGSCPNAGNSSTQCLLVLPAGALSLRPTAATTMPKPCTRPLQCRSWD